MRPAGADQGRCDADPHQRRRQRRMGVRRVRVQTQQITVGFGTPAANVQARSSRGPGSHCGGTVFTAPRVQSAAIPTSRGSPAVRTSGVFSSVRDISGCQSRPRRSSRRAPAARQTGRRRPTAVRRRRPARTCPGRPAPRSGRSTAGGTDSAEKKDSWLTPTTVSQPRHERCHAPRLSPRGRRCAEAALMAKRKPPAPSATGAACGGSVSSVTQTERTPVAWGPLGLCPTSNSTRWFSSRVRKPLP